MALSAELYGAHPQAYAISVTGIAGPTGGTPEKPVGTVCVAVSNGKKTETFRFQFSRTRQLIVEATVLSALYRLYLLLKQDGF